MIKEWLESYNPKNQAQAEQALREIMQEIALAGLQRSGFFEHAAFYGGTALRIFHDLERFSEDLDFSLLGKNPEFSLQPYTEGIISEFAAAGMKINIREKKKTAQTQIESAFLKPDTVWNELELKKIIPQNELGLRPSVMIKLEVDKNPPLGFDTEEKLLLRPFSFYVKCFVLSDLFAGKMHALLFRKWGRRVKGRDWFDMEWYIKKRVPLNLSHFIIRANDSGSYKEKKITEKAFMELLEQKIDTVSFKAIREDIVRFIPDDKMIAIWDKKYFKDLVTKIKFT
ncbi:MAG: nucleotidyl transferase AbiEii/AbiGii toxin family protein [Bacteroidetes bacterium]|nr:nucleotidyl transferase AbiEii/AbiGii toxin family protein [Bacteroidota bacterium]